ncbi:MAG: hypothetical protein JW871_04530 [Endomicrobiales bacterium]|nr:hypothetical protein [Endomicrobiales bacterium]
MLRSGGMLKDKIKSLLSDSWDEIKDLVDKRQKLKNVEAIKYIDKEINSIVNRINSLAINGRKISSEQLDLGHVDRLGEFLGSRKYAKYKKIAEENLLNGKFAVQFLFAGGATRFGLGSMWGLDLASIGDVVLGNYKSAEKYINKKSIGKILVALGKEKTALKFISKKEADKFKAGIAARLNSKQIRKAYLKLKKFRKKLGSVHIGMGPRQFIQFRIKLEKLADKYGVDKSKVLSNACIVLNLNSEVFNEARRNLTINDFYGFNPENIYILIQPAYNGYLIKGKDIVENKESQPLPLGHGHATMQMFFKKEAVRISSTGRVNKVKQSVIEQLLRQGCNIMMVQRINDMTKWTDDVIDINKLAYVLYQIKERNKDVVVELVENPCDQKGGHWLRVHNKEFLSDTLSTNRPDIRKFMYSHKNLPYNAFRNAYNLRVLKNRINKSYNLKLNLRFKEGEFSLESVTGDLTLLFNSCAFQRKKEVIHDIKNIVNYIQEGIDYTIRQEKDPRFAALAYCTN